MMPSNGESGGESSVLAQKSCAIWCVAELCNDKEYNDVEQIAISHNLPTDSYMKTSQVLQLAKASGLGCNYWLTNSLNIANTAYPDTVQNLLRTIADSSGNLSHTIVGTNDHYVVAIKVLNNGATLKVKDPNINGTTNHDISIYEAAIY